MNSNLPVAIAALAVAALIGVGYWYYELRKMEKRRDQSRSLDQGEPVGKKP